LTILAGRPHYICKIDDTKDENLLDGCVCGTRARLERPGRSRGSAAPAASTKEIALAISAIYGFEVLIEMGFDEGQGITGGSNETFVAVAKGSSFDEDDDIGIDRVTGVSLDNEAEFSVVDEEFLDIGQLGVGGIDNVVVFPDNGLVGLHDLLVMRSLDIGESTGGIELNILGQTSGGDGRSKDTEDEHDAQDSEVLGDASKKLVGAVSVVDVFDGEGDIVGTNSTISIEVELAGLVLEGLGEFGNRDGGRHGGSRRG
jgi:hypothetical protein